MRTPLLENTLDIGVVGPSHCLERKVIDEGPSDMTNLRVVERDKDMLVLLAMSSTKAANFLRSGSAR